MTNKQGHIEKKKDTDQQVTSISVTLRTKACLLDIETVFGSYYEVLRYIFTDGSGKATTCFRLLLREVPVESWGLVDREEIAGLLGDHKSLLLLQLLVHPYKSLA